MLKLKTVGLVAATALALSVAQPKPAEAGNAGKIIAGIALGAIALGVLSHAHRAHAYSHDYYYEPEVYYQPHPYAYYPDYDHGYYGPPPHHKLHKHHKHHKNKHARKKTNRWLESHPAAARYR